jgi:hypothetical protein
MSDNNNTDNLPYLSEIILNSIDPEILEEANQASRDQDLFLASTKPAYSRVICTSNKDPEDITNNQTGIIKEVGDIEDLEETVKKLEGKKRKLEEEIEEYNQVKKQGLFWARFWCCKRKKAEEKAKGTYKIRVWTPERGWEDSKYNREENSEEDKIILS